VGMEKSARMEEVRGPDGADDDISTCLLVN
jgi:hypothetical protein